MEGNHWVTWYKNKEDRYHYDSYAGLPTRELQIHMKTEKEMKFDQRVVKWAVITVQHDVTSECGALYLFVLFHISRGVPFPAILTNYTARTLAQQESSSYHKT